MGRETKRTPLGELIRALRKHHEWTQYDLAAKLDQQQSNVSGWELGAAEPRVRTLCKLAEVFKMPAKMFFAAAGETDVEPVGADRTAMLTQNRWLRRRNRELEMRIAALQSRIAERQAEGAMATADHEMLRRSAVRLVSKYKPGEPIDDHYVAELAVSMGKTLSAIRQEAASWTTKG